MNTTSTGSAASRQNSTFARAAVYSEFRARDARAIDQADFVDRTPDQAPRPHVVDDVLRVVNQQGLER